VWRDAFAANGLWARIRHSRRDAKSGWWIRDIPLGPGSPVSLWHSPVTT
jgi:hypothetical protein